VSSLKRPDATAAANEGAGAGDSSSIIGSRRRRGG
jgi:hypothetical protein